MCSSIWGGVGGGVFVPPFVSRKRISSLAKHTRRVRQGMLQSSINNRKAPIHPFVPHAFFSNNETCPRRGFLFSISPSFPPPSRRKKDIMAPLRASACHQPISFSRPLPPPPRLPLERTDGRTWSQPSFRSLLPSGVFC